MILEVFSNLKASMPVLGSHTVHFTAAWPVLHLLFQVWKKSLIKSRVINFPPAEAKSGGKPPVAGVPSSRTWSRQRGPWGKEQTEQVQGRWGADTELLCCKSSSSSTCFVARAHLRGTLWPWAGDCWSGQGNTENCWHRLASCLPKSTGKRKRVKIT